MTKELTSIIDAVDEKRVAGRPRKDAADKWQPEPGKKEQRQAEAEKIATGKFAPRPAPRLVVGGSDT
jgi:hypothetical protein